MTDKPTDKATIQVDVWGGELHQTHMTADLFAGWGDAFAHIRTMVDAGCLCNILHTDFKAPPGKADAAMLQLMAGELQDSTPPEGVIAVMRVTVEDTTFWVEGHDITDAYEAFGEELKVDFLYAAPGAPLCQDEGCPHHGKPHVCVSKPLDDARLKELTTMWRGEAKHMETAQAVGDDDGVKYGTDCIDTANALEAYSGALADVWRALRLDDPDSTLRLLLAMTLGDDKAAAIRGMVEQVAPPTPETHPGMFDPRYVSRDHG